MARGDQALRQWKILTSIMSRPRYGITQNQLLNEIDDLVPRGKGKRTLQRDLQVLELSGFPIIRSVRSSTRQTTYKILSNFQRVPPILPTTDELIALSAARSLLTMYEGTPFKKNLDTFWQKTQAIFPEDARKLLEETEAQFGTLARPAADFKQHKSLLENAIKKRGKISKKSSGVEKLNR